MSSVRTILINVYLNEVLLNVPECDVNFFMLISWFLILIDEGSEDGIVTKSALPN